MPDATNFLPSTSSFIHHYAFSADDIQRRVSLVVHSTVEFELSETPFMKAALECALELPCVHDGEARDILGDKTIFMYVLRAGYNGRSYAVKNTSDKAISVCVDFTKGSKNLVSHRGVLKFEQVIQPGQTESIHHVMISDEHAGG